MAVIFKDLFTEGSDTELSAHTPDTGTGWTKIIGIVNGVSDLGSDSDMTVFASSDDLGADTPGLNDGALYTADVTYPSADYSVQVTSVTVDTNDDVNVLGLRIQDADNMYVLYYSEDIFEMWKKTTAGGWAQIGTDQGSQVVDGDIVRFEIIGTALKAFVDGVQIMSETDSSHSSAGKAGWGMGDVGITAGDDSSAQTVDNFIVNEIKIKVEDSASSLADSDRTASLTVSAGDVLIACIGVHQGTVLDVDWNGTSLTQGPAATTAFNERAEIWYDLTPETGTHTLTFDGTGGSGRFMYGVVLSGVDTSSIDQSGTNTGSDSSIES